jgi:hypothetical protein
MLTGPGDFPWLDLSWFELAKTHKTGEQRKNQNAVFHPVKLFFFLSFSQIG